MNILITGATGLVGRKLGKELVERGHQIFVISRDREKALLDLPFPAHIIEGDLSRETLRDDSLRDMDAVIHLAGENIAQGRWTAARKQRIYDSRVQSLQNLIGTLQDCRKLKVFVSASAIGIYGDRGDEILTESSDGSGNVSNNNNNNRGEGFLSLLCQDWERPLLIAGKKGLWANVRSVILRFGVVLSSEGGALEKMMAPFHFGLGGALGTGRQWISWIHLEDLVNLLIHSIEKEEMSGIYNATAPSPVTNQEFSQILAKNLGNKASVAVPSVALKMVLGEMASIVLSSQRVQSERLAQTSFQFSYPDLDAALQQACRHSSGGDFVFISEQYFKHPLNKIFPFFSDANNLQKITPPNLHFLIKSISTSQMQSGTQIQYRLKIRGFPVHWITQIENWQPDHFFSDSQLKGPYKKWHHTHTFKTLGGGTLMTDTVRYRLPMGIAGNILAGRWVRQDIEKIFAYRKTAVTGLLPRASL